MRISITALPGVFCTVFLRTARAAAVMFAVVLLSACVSNSASQADNADVHKDISGVASKAGNGEPPFDEDGDGIIDRNDACPYTPQGAKVNSFGCVDDDKDGVPDLLDTCKGTAPKVPVDKWGCPVKPEAK